MNAFKTSLETSLYAFRDKMLNDDRGLGAVIAIHERMRRDSACCAHCP